MLGKAVTANAAALLAASTLSVKYQTNRNKIVARAATNNKLTVIVFIADAL
jgi:hypothetical protein